MAEDFPGQGRQQVLMQYSMASSFFAALVAGIVSQSMRAGWNTCLVGLFFTWLISVVEWGYFFDPPSSWSEGKYLDVTGYYDLEERDRIASKGSSSLPRLHRAQITLFGGPASRMTISSRPDLRSVKKKFLS